jgi:hypothetical protein
MPRLERKKVRALLRRVDRTQTQDAKGAAWEALGKYIFASIPGLSVSSTNREHILDQYEVDIAMWNEQLPSGLKSLPDVIFIEAKNWAGRVNAAAIRSFDSKLNQQGLTFGVLIAANGVTGDAADRTAGHGVGASALTPGRRIIVITRAEVESLASGQQLVRLIKQKICELVVAGSAIS